MTVRTRLAGLLRKAGVGRPAQPEGAMRDFLDAAKRLRPGDIAIDCGANVGRFTRPIAESGATVHAFEPNPDAFAELSHNLAGFPSVHLHQQAVAARPGAVKLYLHEFAESDPVKWSTGSSLLAFKGNVREEAFVTVEAVDFVAFLEALDRPVALLKMDIEGAEVAVLERLLERGLHDRIERAFVEVHDRKIPELIEPTNRLRQKLNDMQVTHIDLSWH